MTRCRLGKTTTQLSRHKRRTRKKKNAHKHSNHTADVARGKKNARISIGTRHRRVPKNYNKLEIYAVEQNGIRTVCRARLQYYAQGSALKNYKSNNNVVVINLDDLPLCIDGWNVTSGECYNKGDYVNDFIGWESDQGRWSGESFLDNFDSSKIILRPLIDIVKGEQIYTWYGPLYCCDPQHQVDQMAI